MIVQTKSLDMGSDVTDVYDNLLEPEIAEQISNEMKTLLWKFEHYSDKDANNGNANIHWNIWGGDSVDEVTQGHYSDILLPIWNAIIEKKVAYKYRVTEFRRCYMNAHTFGIEPHVHKDDGDFTMLYYPRMDWKLEWGGGTSVYDELGEEINRHVPYKGNRLLVFDAYLPHQAMTVSRQCYQLRSVIVFKCYVQNNNRQRLDFYS